jgi:hypothetical protein
MIAHRIHSVFSRRPSVNPEFPSPTVPIHPVAALVRLTPPHPRAVAPAKRSRYPRPSRSSASASHAPLHPRRRPRQPRPQLAPGHPRPPQPIRRACRSLTRPSGMTVDRNPRETGGNCPRFWPPPDGPHQPPRQPRGARPGRRAGYWVPKSPSSGVWRPTMIRPCRRSSRRVNSRRVPATWWRLRTGPGSTSRNAPEIQLPGFHHRLIMET